MLVAALSGARGHFGARWASRVPGASLALLVALLAYAALSTPSSVAAPSKGPIIVAHLEGEVDPLTAEYVHRALSAATDRHASLLVLTIDTPGGLDSSMRQMVQDILNSPVPTVAYVSPPGARAASAGVFVAEASNVVAPTSAPRTRSRAAAKTSPATSATKSPTMPPPISPVSPASGDATTRGSRTPSARVSRWTPTRQSRSTSRTCSNRT